MRVTCSKNSVPPAITIPYFRNSFPLCQYNLRNLLAKITMADNPNDARIKDNPKKDFNRHPDPYCSCLGIYNDQMSVLPKFALSLSGCGFLGVYHFGSAVCLGKHGRQILNQCDRFAGASAGSLVAAMLVTCPEKMQESLTAWYSLADEVIQKPFGAMTADFSLIDRVTQYVDSILPIDAHKLANGRLFISVTCRDDGVNYIVSQFGSREYLLKYLVSSCYIPFYAGASVPPLIDGKEYVDGGFSTNLPKFTDRQTITISPFSGEADISPEDGRAMFDWRVTLANQIVKITMGNVKRGMQALFPPSMRILQEYYTLGYVDTMKFLMKHRYFERDEGTAVIDHADIDRTNKTIAVVFPLRCGFVQAAIMLLRSKTDGRTRVTIHGAAKFEFVSGLARKKFQENPSEFEGWDTWGTNEGRKRQKTESEQRIEAYRQRLSTAREELERAASVEEDKTEMNYFESLQPELKPVKKIMLKPKINAPSNMPSSSNRFAVQSDINVYMSNTDNTLLGDLDDTCRPIVPVDESMRPWDVDEASLDVDSVLKEAKHRERQQRLEEQRRKKMDKQRLSSKHSLEAVKIS